MMLHTIFAARSSSRSLSLTANATIKASFVPVRFAHRHFTPIKRPPGKVYSADELAWKKLVRNKKNRIDREEVLARRVKEAELKQQGLPTSAPLHENLPSPAVPKYKKPLKRPSVVQMNEVFERYAPQPPREPTDTELAKSHAETATRPEFVRVDHPIAAGQSPPVAYTVSRFQHPDPAMDLPDFIQNKWKGRMEKNPVEEEDDSDDDIKVIPADSKDNTAISASTAAVSDQNTQEAPSANLERKIMLTGDEKFAVVEINKRQHKVFKDDVLMCDKLQFRVGEKLIFDKVLLLGSRDSTLLGLPYVPNCQVKATVEEQTQLAKIVVFKKKRRKGYRRTKGHRSLVTVLRINDIIAPSQAQTATTASAT
jgi:large subunit ribosomal protein L21